MTIRDDLSHPFQSVFSFERINGLLLFSTTGFTMSGEPQQKRLIQCGGCEAVFEPEVLACPNCGSCPGCGQKRISKAEKVQNCAECDVPYCAGCGRCHGCGKTRFIDLPTCSCGHPDNEDRLDFTYRTFRFIRNKSSKYRLLEAVCIAMFMLLGQLAIQLWL